MFLPHSSIRFRLRMDIMLLVGLVVGLIAVFLIPWIDKALFPAQTAPGLVTFLGIGIVLTVLTAGLLYWGLRSQLPNWQKFIGFALLYNVLIILVKFVLSPMSVYEFNRSTSISFNIENPIILIVLSGGVFVLYAVVFRVLYGYYLKKAMRGIPAMDTSQKKPIKKGMNVFWRLLFAALIFAVVGFVMVIPLLLLQNQFEYLSIVFSSIFGLLIALALIAAILLATALFSSAAEQAIAMRDITVLTTFFWIGLIFLFLYHALWAVYFFMIASLWPLRIVVPK